MPHIAWLTTSSAEGSRVMVMYTRVAGYVTEDWYFTRTLLMVALRQFSQARMHIQCLPFVICRNIVSSVS